MGDIRIVVVGQAAFGESVLNALVDRGDTVVAAWCPPDVDGGRVDRLKAAAEKRGVPVFQFKRMRDREAIDAFRALNADLCVMAFVTDIVPGDILNAPARGTVQYHPSLLPKHRGPSSINWPIIQGETRTGLTVFWPDEGLDTGPVLLQKTVDIDPDDTLGSLYFDKLFPLGVDAMLESVDMVRDGAAPKRAQDESQATYEGWCRPEDVIIDWQRPLGEIYNLVRGSDPSPGAGTTYRGSGVRYYGAERWPNGPHGRPGEVIEISDRGFAVAAQGGSLFVRRVQPGRDRKMAAGDWASATGLAVGDRFGV